MPTLHTFGCSITQGFALPDVVQPLLNSQGEPLSLDEIQALDNKPHWEQIHLYAPSQYAWPAVLAQQLNIPHQNHARRGACFQQIARQCAAAAKDIQPEDTVIVMWTYLCRLSLQWPARTAVPFCNIASPHWGFHTVMLGINKFFGLSYSAHSTDSEDAGIQKHIKATAESALDPLGVYNHYYNKLVLQCMTDGFLRATGARVIHLSVETQPVLGQLEVARQALPPSLQTPYTIPDPSQWYDLAVDYSSCLTIHDPSIPPAENDMHPSVTHHRNFALQVYNTYFCASNTACTLWN